MVPICILYTCQSWPFSSSLKIANFCWLRFLLTLDLWETPSECSLDPCDRDLLGNSAQH